MKPAHIFKVVTLIAALFLGNAQAIDKETKLYDFQNNTGGSSPGGFNPVGVLLVDASGNLYGAAKSGGLFPPEGTIFELSPNGSGGWNYNVIFNCSNTGDCGTPVGSLVMDTAGNLYGSNGGFEKVFELSPDGSGGWNSSLVYQFNGGTNGYDGFAPGPVIVDTAGNLYGANMDGGINNQGYIFELSPASSGGWTLTHLHDFIGSDGSVPFPALIMDASGNLYGTASLGGSSTQCSGGCGVVFELSNSAGTWTETVLHSFSGKDGSSPQAPLYMDAAGHLYGTATAGGAFNLGVVFKMSLNSGTWTTNPIHNFSCQNGDGATPNSVLIADAAGNLYGTTGSGGGNNCPNGQANGYGMAFELSTQNGKWKETVLHDFTAHGDGGGPQGLSFGIDGNLYGVAIETGVGGGVAFELSPATAK